MACFQVQHIDHVAITVRDIPASVAWYQETLGLEHRPVADWGDYPQMVCAEETCVALFPAESGGDEDARPAITMTHFAFRLDRENFARAEGRLEERGIEFRFANHGVAHSLYISDPDGHTIELTTYEL